MTAEMQSLTDLDLEDCPNYWAFELFTTLIRHKNGICLLYLSRDDWFAIAGKVYDDDDNDDDDDDDDEL
uniref:Uncharacterized protein n=1 Tax=Quercus lobata TaxID=97700 RepID=A0A7N2MHK9_QUELO